MGEENNCQLSKELENNLNIQKDVALELAKCLDVVFGTEKELKNILGILSVSVEYSIYHDGGSEVFFAKFKVHKGLTEINRTILFDIYHSCGGFNPDRRYVESECKNFVYNAKLLK